MRLLCAQKSAKFLFKLVSVRSLRESTLCADCLTRYGARRDEARRVYKSFSIARRDAVLSAVSGTLMRL